MNDRCTQAWTTRVGIPWIGHVSVPNRDDTVTGHSVRKGSGHPQAQGGYKLSKEIFESSVQRERVEELSAVELS